MPVSDQLLYPALRLAGVLTAAGRTASPSQMEDAFECLNRLIDTWRTQQYLVFRVESQRWTLSPSQTSYTIGPGADFDIAQRPIEITDANIVLTGTGTEVHCPLRLLDDHEWAWRRVREIPTTIPTEMYYNHEYPIARIFLWGYPTMGNDLELFYWNQLQQFTSQGDPVTWPPGYEEAVVNSLAVRLCAIFRIDPTPSLVQQARETRAWLKGLQSPSPKIPSADYGTAGSRGRSGGTFNYLIGGPGR